MSATAPSTTCGGRCSNISTPILIGLTATPDNRTYGFFQKNVVSEYSHEQAVADGVNVGNEIYVIETEVTQAGRARSRREQQVEKRERLTRKKRWEQQDEDEAYSANAARPRRRQPGPDPHRHPHFPRQTARDLPRPRRSAQDPHLRQDRQPRRRHHPDRPRGVRRGQRLLQEDHLPGRRKTRNRSSRSSATTTTRASP